MQPDGPTPSIADLALPRRRMPPPAPDAWRQFIAWPGSTSLVTLVSAALLLAGLHGVIEPSIGVEGSTGPRWQVLGTLSSYLAALVSGIWAMCRARSGHPDAIASAAVGTAFAVGFGIVIQLIAPEQPGLALAAAIAGWVGLVLLGLGFARIAGGGWGGVGIGITVLLAWTTGWPLLLSHVVVEEGARMATAPAGVGGTDVAVMVWWTVGWGTMLLGLVWFIQGAARLSAGLAGQPFLARPEMRWTLLLVALLAAIIALAVQAHIAGLDVALTDVTPAGILLCLLGGELAARVQPSSRRDALLVAVPAVASAWFTLAGWGPDVTAQFRGQGWAPDLVALAGTAPVAPVLSTLSALVLAWRRRSTGLLVGAAIAVIAATLAWEGHRPLWAEAGLCTALLGTVLAWRAQRPGWVVAMLAVMAGLAPATLVAAEALGRGLPSAGLAVAAASALVLLAGAWNHAWVDRGWARSAAIAMGLVALEVALHLMSSRGQPVEVVPLVVSLLLIIVCAVRRRDLLLGAAIGPALLVLGWPLLIWLMPRSRAWLAVWGAFALLGAGVLLSVRRARTVRPAASDAAPPA